MPEFEVPDLWVVAYLRIDAGDKLTVELSVRENPDRRREYVVLVELPSQPTETPAIREFSDIATFVLEVADSLPERYASETRARAPLAVFVHPPQGLEELDWETAIESAVGTSPQGGHVTCSRLRHAEWLGQGRTPFTLPLRMVAIDPVASHALAVLRQREWYLRDSVVAEHGFKLDHAFPESLSRLLPGDAVQDIAVMCPLEVHFALAEIARTEIATRPRLVVVMDPHGAGTPSDWWRGLAELPSGVALLWLDGMDDALGECFAHFVRCLVHDYPLHEAASVARRLLKENTPRVRLAADPQTNRSLRLIDAYMHLESRVAKLETNADPGDVEAFLARLGDAVPGDLSQLLRSAFDRAAPSREATREFRRLYVNFLHEGDGLKPISEAEAVYAHAEAARRDVEGALATIADTKDFAELLKTHQQRTVDIGLWRLERSPLVGNHRPQPDALAVDRRTILRRNTAYVLKVRIGRPFPRSLVVGDPPPLDPLLPPAKKAEGHEISVVVFGMDFFVQDSNILTLLLPPLGGSDPVSFVVFTPNAVGEARLRVALYHENQLLQMFLLDARIGNEEAESPTDSIQATFEIAQTRAFHNLDDLGKRQLSIGINDDPFGSTHTITFKRDGTARTVRLPEKALDVTIKEFRALMTDATAYVDTSNRVVPRYPTYPIPGTKPSAKFDETVRRLARLGKKLYDAIWRALPDADASAVKRDSDKVLQIIRAGPTYVFPWTLLYDFTLPTEIFGDTPAPVCLGDGCGHGSEDEVLCVKGFWGVRHHIEELIAGQTVGRDAAKELARPKKGLPVRLALDRAADDLLSTIAKGGATTQVAELTAGETLLALLWDSQTRPAILVVLGHLETAQKLQEPDYPRIHVRSEGSWLFAELISQTAQNKGRWDTGPLVELMSCGSGATDIETLNNLVLAFHDAGAAAVLGTECLVDATLAERFGGEVTAALLKGDSLGQAVTSFRRRLFAEGNPLAFVFNVIGSADLRMAP